MFLVYKIKELSGSIIIFKGKIKLNIIERSYIFLWDFLNF